MDNFDELLITTGVDRLIKLVKEKGRIDIESSSKLLNISPNNIEEWANILEQEGILKIEYRLGKVFLVWVTKSKEEVEKEIDKFKEKKEEIVRSIEAIGSHAEREEKELEKLRQEFDRVLSSIQPKVDALTKKVEQIREAQGDKERKYYSLVDKAENFRARVSEIRDAINLLTTQLKRVKEQLGQEGVEDRLRTVESSKEKIAELNLQLESLKQRSDEVVKNLQRASPAVEVGSIEEYQRKSDHILKRLEGISEIVASVKGAVEAIKSSSTGLEEYEKRIKGTIKEIESVEKQASELSSRISGINKEITEQKSALKQIDDYLDLAREVMSKFATIDNLLSEVKSLKEDSSRLRLEVERARKAAEEASKGFGDIEAVISELSDVREKIEEERNRLATESGTILATLDEEMANYSTFQRIKEKTLQSIQNYLDQLERLGEEYSILESEIEAEEAKVDQKFVEVRKELEALDASEVISETEDLLEKMAEVKKASEELDSLRVEAVNLNKQLKLLAQQAKLISITSSQDLIQLSSDVKEAEAKSESIEEKRNRLRKLIKKVWEENKDEEK
ncbi:MAG: hypothetical protein QW035_00785 [Candidatus Anstonellales archaeon]